MNWVEAFRSAYNIAGILVVGMLVFPSLAGRSDKPEIRRWHDRLVRSCTWLAGLLLVGALSVFWAKAREIDPGGPLLVGGAAFRSLAGTHVGTVWLLRAFLALALGAILALGRRPFLAARPTGALLRASAAGIALAGLAIGTYAGHVAGLEPKWLGASLDAVHLFAIAAWLGGLPALVLLFALARRSGDEAIVAYASAALARFSIWAVTMSGLLVASGLGLAYLLLKGLPAWFGAKFGWPDLLEIVLLLPLVALTWHLRWRLFPLPGRDGHGPVRWGRVAAVGGAAIACLYVFLGAFPELVGTSYGRLLSAKVVVLGGVFAIAGHVRWDVLPRLAAGQPRGESLRRIGRWVVMECALGVLIVMFGSVLAETLPSIHDQIGWPFAFRLSVAATWSDPSVQWRTYAGVGLILASTLWGAIAWQATWRAGRAAQPPRKSFWAAGATMLTGLIVTLTSISVPAFPATYRRSDAPFEAVSVAGGVRLFDAHCTGCHGVSGRGDGVGAARLPKKPANLTEPHTALHTAGDMFWWLGHGIPASGMPAFGAKLSEEQRWDVVNFLRAFSTGYQARIIESAVVSHGPWLGAPDFDFAAQDRSNGRLKDLRGQSALVLVFFSWPGSQHRLDELAREYARLTALGAEVLAIPVGQSALQAARTGALPALPFPVVTDGAEVIAQTYALFGRTLGRMGDDTHGVMPEHLEFLIDRYGYIRARWIADAAGAAWPRLAEQLSILGGEPQLLAYPDEHVH